jgi:MSHA pilin protein MshD
MTKRLQKGFTLIELLIFIVVVGVGLAGILSVMNTVVKSSADPMVRKQTLAVAESLLEEILLKDYAKPSGSTVVGFSSGGNRALYDCVDDYNNYTANPITDVLGTSVAGLVNYSISPAIVVVSSADLTGVAAKKITVSVSGPGGTLSLSGYRSNY